MHHAWKPWTVVAVVLLAMLGASCSKEKEPEQPSPAARSTADDKGAVTGVLKKVAAVGGETTGFAVEYKAGEEPRQQEISGDPKMLEKYLDKRVFVSGRYVVKDDVERGQVRVLVVDEIHVLKKNPTPKEDEEKGAITGMLKKVDAVGGETTGFAVEYKAGGETQQQEISGDPETLEKYVDQRVFITGRYVIKDYVERDQVRVLVVEEIRPLKEKPAPDTPEEK